VVSSEKYERIIIPTIGETKIHVPNHQPVTDISMLDIYHIDVRILYTVPLEVWESYGDGS
jgi:hypothetical protein